LFRSFNAADFRLHSIGAAAAVERAGQLPSSSKLSNTTITSGSISRAADDVSSMQLEERGKGECSAVGNTRRSYRCSVHLSAFSSFPASQRSAQMFELRT